MDNLVKQICESLDKKKARNIEIISIADQTVIADYFIVCDASSTTLVKTLCETVEEDLEASGTFALRKEGFYEGRWIVLDYANIIVHIFLDVEREYYNIEKVWANASNITEYVK